MNSDMILAIIIRIGVILGGQAALLLMLIRLGATQWFPLIILSISAILAKLERDDFAFGWYTAATLCYCAFVIFAT